MASLRSASTSKPADQKNAARDFTASPRSLPSFLFSTDPITVPRSSPSGAQFRRCSRRYYINNDPAGQIIGSNEKREGKGGEGKKRKVILSFLSRSAFPFTRLRKWTYFIFPTRIRRYTLSDHRISSTSTRSDFNFYSSRCYARGRNITVCIISKIPAMTSGVRFLWFDRSSPFRECRDFREKRKRERFEATRPQLNKYARLYGFHAFKSPRNDYITYLRSRKNRWNINLSRYNCLFNLSTWLTR